MSSTIILSDNGASSGSAGLKTTGGNDGVLILQTTTSGGTATNALYVDNKQVLGMGVTPSTTWDTSLVKALQIADNGASIASYTSYNTSGKYLFLSANAVYDGVSGSGWKYLQTGYASQYTLQNYKHIWSSATTNTAGTGIGWTQVMSVELNSTLALQGASTQTGTGITFPASQSASSDANTLDDYEEGTFNVAVAFSGASVGVTYNNNTFSYTKIGNMVHVRGYLYLSNKGSSTGTVTISGLPFNVKNSTPNYVPVSFWFTSMTYSGEVTAYVVPGNSYIILGQTTTGGTFSQLTNSNFTNTTEIMVSLSYAAE